MISAWLKRRFDRMGQAFAYDVSYVHELLDADPEAGRKFALAAMFLSQPPKVAKNAFWAAKLVACKHADCGPCLRLVIKMAKREGIDGNMIRDILLAVPADADAALGQAYAYAVLDNTPNLLELIGEIERRWGKKGLANMSASVISGLFYPVFKRGFGHGLACEPVLKELERAA